MFLIQSTKSPPRLRAVLNPPTPAWESFFSEGIQQFPYPPLRGRGKPYLLAKEGTMITPEA